MLDLDRCKNIMTWAKVQPFCRKHGLDIGVCIMNSESILPQTVRQKNICLYLYRSHFCVNWKQDRRTSSLDAVFEMGDNFKHAKTQKYDNILKQNVEYKFPLSYEMNWLFIVFAFDPDTYNVETSEYYEANAAGVNHFKNLYGCFNGDLSLLLRDPNFIHLIEKATTQFWKWLIML